MEENKEVIVIKVMPDKRAKVIRQNTEWYCLQLAVGGVLEFVHPFKEDVCIVCNDCGRYQSKPNRIIDIEESGYCDVIFGTFLIMRECNFGFEDLTIDDIKKYLPIVDNPNEFVGKLCFTWSGLPLQPDDLRYNYIDKEDTQGDE